jgi:hypothetical protein
VSFPRLKDKDPAASTSEAPIDKCVCLNPKAKLPSAATKSYVPLSLTGSPFISGVPLKI